MIPVEGNLTQHVEPYPLTQLPMPEFAVAPTPWNMRHNIQQLTPTQSIDVVSIKKD